MLNNTNLRNKVAAIIHAQWSHWMQHVLTSKVQMTNIGAVLNLVDCARWERQIATPFENLNEDEKASDLKLTQPYIDIMVGIIDQQRAFFNLTVRDKCKFYSIQDCGNCSREECGDNTNPLILRIRELEKTLQEKEDK